MTGPKNKLLLAGTHPANSCQISHKIPCKKQTKFAAQRAQGKNVKTNFVIFRQSSLEYPEVWVWPQVPLGGPPPSTPCALGPCRKSQGGWGEDGRRGRGGKGFGLREGSSNDNGGWGRPPNTSWGQTHIWGLPIHAMQKRQLGKYSGGITFWPFFNFGGLTELCWPTNQDFENANLLK